MPADLMTEDLVLFQNAAEAFPGKRVSYQTLRRWRTAGIRGAVLETCVIGGARYTTRQAIQRFIQTQNPGGGC